MNIRRSHWPRLWRGFFFGVHGPQKSRYGGKSLYRRQELSWKGEYFKHQLKKPIFHLKRPAVDRGLWTSLNKKSRGAGRKYDCGNQSCSERLTANSYQPAALQWIVLLMLDPVLEEGRYRVPFSFRAGRRRVGCFPLRDRLFAYHGHGGFTCIHKLCGAGVVTH